MTPAAIIHEAASRGVTLRVEGTDLLYHGPRGALCPKLKAALKAHKPAIICELMGSDTSSAFCPADVIERSAIIAEGEGCSRLEADRRALAEHGQPSWRDLAERHRVEITSALERLPKRCTAEGTRLLDVTRKFVASLFFDEVIELGWSRIELFGIAPDAPKTDLGTWGLIVTQVLLLRGGRIEAISEERAILWTRAGTVLLWPRFRSEINACVLWWECPEFVQSNES